MRIDLIIGTTMIDGIRVPVKRKMDEEDLFVQYYEGIEPIRATLDKASNTLLGYIIRTMDTGNRVFINKSFRAEFNDYVVESNKGGNSYSDSAIHNALVSLRKTNILLETNTRGFNFLNPLYVFKGTQKERIKAVKRINTEIIRKHFKDSTLEEPKEEY